MLSVLLSAASQGLLWALVAFGVFITYRILDFADLTTDGTVAFGGATCALLITVGADPLLATLAATVMGCFAGLLTGVLATKARIPAILSGILVQLALYSINLRVMDNKSNLALLRKPTVFRAVADLLGVSNAVSELIVGLFAVVLCGTLLWLFLRTEKGLAIRATGGNPRMIRASGVNTDSTTILALMIANALIGLGGSLLAQQQGYSDVQMGVGAIVIGLASVVIGEVLFGRRSLLRSLIAVALGSIVYRCVIALIMLAPFFNNGDLKILTAAIVGLALWIPRLKRPGGKQKMLYGGRKD